MSSPLGSLPGHQLLARVHALVRRGNAVEAELLAHLGEVDARKLFLDEACPSMFVYCQRVLHFPEAVAYKRICTARAARRHPAILEAVRRGDLHVTGVSLLAPQLAAESCEELIRAAKHKTADEIRRLLAEKQPMPDVVACMHRVPTPASPESAARPVAQANPAAGVSDAAAAGNAVDPALGEAGKGTLAESAPAAPHSGPPAHRAHTEPLGGERYCVRFTADRSLHEQLLELQALMRHQVPDGDLGKILARAVGVLLEQVRKRKFGECAEPRPAKPSSERPSRQVPAAVRRAVSRRDEGRCTYVSTDGRRCGAREFLEFHHRDPWARNREHTVEGIALRCRAHNQHEARRDFGERHMARFRGRKPNAYSGGPNARPMAGRTASPQLDLDPVHLEKTAAVESDGGVP